MNLMRLTDGTNVVDFSPVQDSLITSRITDISRWRSSAGDGFSYLWFTDKFRYQFGLNLYVRGYADRINTWCKNNTPLTFWPDRQNFPGISRSVLIVNDEDPMQQFTPQWKRNYTGTVNLEEQ